MLCCSFLFFCFSPKKSSRPGSKPEVRETLSLIVSDFLSVPALFQVSLFQLKMLFLVTGTGWMLSLLCLSSPAEHRAFDGLSKILS